MSSPSSPAKALQIRPHLADRLLLSEIFQRTFLVLFSVVTLFLLFDALESGQINLLQQSGLRTFLLNQLLEVPARIYELLPLAVLLGSIWALSLMGRHHELTILRVSGFTVGRLMKLLMAFGLGLGLIGMTIDEWLDPWVRQSIHAVLQNWQGEKTQKPEENIWIRYGTHLIHIDHQTLENAQGVQIIKVSPSFDRVERFIFAKRAKILSAEQAAQHSPPLITPNSPPQKADSAIWQLEEGGQIDIPPMAVIPLEFWQTPDQRLLSAVSELHQNHQGASLQSFSQTYWLEGPHWRYLTRQESIQTHQRLSEMWPRYLYNLNHALSTKTIAVILWKKMFYPLVLMVMAVTGLPFCLQSGRAVQTNLRILIGIMLGILFFIMQGIFSNLGIITLPPIPSVLSPILLFLGITLIGVKWAQHR